MFDVCRSARLWILPVAAAGLCLLADIAAASVAQAAAATAVQAPPSAPASLAKDAVCTECHDPSSRKRTLTIYQTRHGVRADRRTPSCQSCHGESLVHVKDAGKPTDVVFAATSKNLSPAPARNAACLTCHDGQARSHWSGSQHERQGLACTNCHNIHAPEQRVMNRATQAEVCFTCHKTQRAQSRRISAHPLTTTSLASGPKMVCSDCHNPHGSSGVSLLAKGSVNETCYRCHAEKRGPYLWEHSPVTDNCMNCHAPHGSASAPLLRTRQPMLCQDCHSGDHANQVLSGANLSGGAVTTVAGLQQRGAAAPRVQMNGRACLGCHSLVHGSNHPAGAKFLR